MPNEPGATSSRRPKLNTDGDLSILYHEPVLGLYALGVIVSLVFHLLELFVLC
jgi:hypothetical protein